MWSSISQECHDDQPGRPRHSPCLGKFVFTGIGLGLLIGVTLVMAGVYRGMVDDGKALLDNSGADLWVVQKDTLVLMRSRPASTMTCTPFSPCRSLTGSERDHLTMQVRKGE
jgi:putative ABC transport system permease protein